MSAAAAAAADQHLQAQRTLKQRWAEIGQSIKRASGDGGLISFGSLNSHDRAARRARQASIHRAESAGATHEEAVLAEFKRMLSERGVALPPEMAVAGDEDATLRRFLRARKWRLDAAFQMLTKSLEWRRAHGVDACLREPLAPSLVSLIRECRPSSYIGFHRDGWPIFVERLGMLDAKRIERAGLGEAELLSYHQREMEFMAQVVFAEASRRTGRTVDRVVSIMDASGLTLVSLTGFAQRLFRAIAGMDSDNYPETCNNIFIVNNAAAFTAIWKVVRVFIDPGTRDKVRVLGSGSAMLSALLAEFDAAQVPSFLGGALDYDARRREWTALMDAAMDEARARAQGGGGGALKAAGSLREPGPPSPVTNGTGRLATSTSLTIRTGGGGFEPASNGGAPQRGPSDGGASDEDGWATPGSHASRVSSAMSVYFDALELQPSPSRGGSSGGGVGSSAGGGAATGGGGWPSPPGSPGGSPRRNGSGAGGFDANMPNYTPTHQHHVARRGSKLPAVPSGELPPGDAGPQPACGCGCVIS